MKCIYKSCMSAFFLLSLISGTTVLAHESELLLVQGFANANPFDRVAAQDAARTSLMQKAQVNCSWRGEEFQAVLVSDVVFKQVPNQFEPILETASAQFRCEIL